MKTTAIEIPLEDKKIQCLIDDGKPVIWIDNHLFTGLKPLVDAHPKLKEPHNVMALAKVVNFLSRCFEFKVVSDIEEFRQIYALRIQEEHERPDDVPTNLSAYGNFDLSVLHAPKIEQQTLRFFVENDYNHLPYQVSLEFPPGADDPSIHYTLLPYASD